MMYNSNRIENIFKVRTLIVIMMCLVLNNIYAHIVFTNFVNLLENQDVYDWIAISNSPSLETGENILWNLTNAECVGEALPIKCFVSNESEKKFDFLKGKTKYSYSLDAHGMFLNKTENKETKVVYNQPELLFSFPCTYMDSVKSNFSGTLISGDKESGDFYGCVKLKVDATGSVIFPNGIRIDSLIRIQHEKEIYYGNSILKLNSYRWYSHFFPYPLLEFEEIYDLRKKLGFVTYYSPSIVQILYDKIANVADRKLENKNVGKKNMSSILMKESLCKVRKTNKGNMELEFQLPTKTEVEYSVCLDNGIVICYEKKCLLEAGRHIKKINVSLTSDNVYILAYIIGGIKGVIKFSR